MKFTYSRNLKGSITVESSIIYPFILLIFATVVIFSFFLHDYIVIQSSAYRETIYLANSHVNNNFSSPDFDEIPTIFNSFCITNRRIKIKYNEKNNLLNVSAFRNDSEHLTNGYEHCNSIRKYSVLIDSIQNMQ